MLVHIAQQALAAVTALLLGLTLHPHQQQVLVIAKFQLPFGAVDEHCRLLVGRSSQGQSETQGQATSGAGPDRWWAGGPVRSGAGRLAESGAVTGWGRGAQRGGA